MEKTSISKNEYDDLVARYPDPSPGMQVDFKRLAEEQEYFCKYALGMRPRTWQSKFWHLCRTSNRVAACTGRQIGKSVAISVDALQSTFFNTRPVGFKQRTLVIMISASDEQSKQLMDNIRALVAIGDENVARLTGGKIKNYFSAQISNTDRNDKSVLTWKNGCRIMSLPPTARVRGYAPSKVFKDESAFIDDEVHDAIKPMVADTNGQIIETTTPNGQQGYFFSIFDPFDDRQVHEYDRLWLDYRCLEHDDPLRVARMNVEEETARLMGEEKKFMQENLADFTAQVGSFFDPEDVDKCVDKETLKQDSEPELCDLGVDFGKVTSRTVISIVKLDRNGVIRLVYQYEYPAQTDLSLIDDIEALMKRFTVQRVIFESCPQEETFRQVAIQKGWNLVEFVPQAEKLKKYTVFRSRVKMYKFKMYNEQELLKQMKGLQYEETPRTTKIYAGSGLRDDRVDSVVIAAKFMLEDSSGVKCFDW
jgi:hypothetical protein